LPILKEGAKEINDALELLDNEFQIFLELKDKIINHFNQEFMQEFNDTKRLTKRYKDYRFKE